MKRSKLLAGFAGLAVGIVAVRRALAAKRDSLNALDMEFHAAYDRCRAADARAAPVFVLFGESLFVFEGERQHEWLASAPATPLIRAAAHVPVGIFAALHERTDPEGTFDVVTAQRLDELCRLQTRSLDALDGLDAESRSDVEQVLEASRDFLEQSLAKAHATSAELASFAAAIGPRLLRLTEHATRLELAALHAAVEAALAGLTREQRDTLEVVVAGAHQARSRSLGLQYFQKRFDEAPGEERRVTYAEAARGAREARDLIGTRRLDRKIALAFFGDAKRLQRDVLGDAAQHQLGRADLGPLLAAEGR